MTKPRREPVKTDKGQQTRAAILEAALEMFLERGYENTTMRATNTPTPSTPRRQPRPWRPRA